MFLFHQPANAIKNPKEIFTTKSQIKISHKPRKIGSHIPYKLQISRGNVCNLQFYFSFTKILKLYSQKKKIVVNIMNFNSADLFQNVMEIDNANLISSYLEVESNIIRYYISEYILSILTILKDTISIH